MSFGFFGREGISSVTVGAVLTTSWREEVLRKGWDPRSDLAFACGTMK